MYYLQSRYYNPEWGSFLNGDEVSCLGKNQDLISYNLILYCSNEPIKNYDPTGMWTFSIGLNYNFFCVAGVSESYYLTLDDDGNLGIQKTEANAIKITLVLFWDGMEQEFRLLYCSLALIQFMI